MSDTYGNAQTALHLLDERIDHGPDDDERIAQVREAITGLLDERDRLTRECDEDQGVIAVWRGRTKRAEDERDEAMALLRRLYALVMGENRSLLNEDSGGDGELKLDIEDLLARREG